MSLPWALLALVALPVLWLLHRGARPSGDQPYSAFFLLLHFVKGDRGRRTLRAPWLLCARAVAALALIIAAVGFVSPPSGGTLVLTAGPFTPDPQWSTPVVVIRAGSTPSEVSEPEGVEPVVASPQWGAALVMGRRLSPEGRLIYLDDRGDFAPLVEGAGAVLAGSRVIVEAQVASGVTPILRWREAGARKEAPLGRAGAGWRLAGPLPAGPAHIVAEEYEGDDGYPICLPDSAPLVVSEGLWPEALAQLWPVLPHVRRGPLEESQWRPGPAPANEPLPEGIWAPFLPQITWIEWPESTTRFDQGPGPVRLVGDLPIPGVSLARWQTLPEAGEPMMFAGEAVIADLTRGRAGQRLRLAFSMEDAELIESPAWPAFFAERLQADRARRGRCRTHRAGQPLMVLAEGEIRLTTPGGHQRVVMPAPHPETGHLVARLDGLDVLGHYTLESGDQTAWIAVVPEVGSADSGAPEAPSDAITAPIKAGQPRHTVPLVVALVALLATLGLSRRWRAPWPWLSLGIVIVALTGPQWRVGDQGGVVLAVDTSASMPEVALSNVVAMVEQAIGGDVTLRVEGGERVRRAGPPGAPLQGSPSGATRHGPLVEGALDALSGGAVVLVTDGRAEDGPVTPGVPVFPVPVGVEGPDGGIISAEARRLGGRLIVRAQVRSNVASAAALIVQLEGAEPVEHPLELQAGDVRTTRLSVPHPADQRARLTVRIEVPGDVWPVNDQWPLAVEADAPLALAIGPGAVPWLEGAGLTTRQLPIEGLRETPEVLRQATVVAVHDQHIEALPASAVAALADWVDGGGVLLLAGRNKAFGPGGWTGAPIEVLSPLTADPEPERPSRLGVAVLLDRSGSMSKEAGGIGAEGIARLTGSLARGLKGPDDQLAVVAFGTDADVLLSPTPARQVNPEDLETPAVIKGGTTIGPALITAAGLLETVDVDRRIILTITDGRFIDEGEPTIPPRLKRSRTQVMAILVGEQPEREPLAGLARITGGRIIEGQGESLPRLITEGLLEVARGELVVPGGSVSVTGSWPARVGVTAPPVAERVRVGLAAGARLLARSGGDPFIAERPWGAGRVIAVATDTWQAPAALWAGLLGPALAPKAELGVLRITPDGRMTMRYAPEQPLPLRAHITDPRGVTVEMPWHLVAPGHASLSLPEGPVEILDVYVPLSTGGLSASLTRPPSTEQMTVGVDSEALALQAEITGGRVVREPQALLEAVTRASAGSGTPMSGVLALLALVIAILEAWRWSGGHLRRIWPSGKD
ncbi:MAG: VWA domain-containing protein [Bradymonadia bacterium]